MGIRQEKTIKSIEKLDGIKHAMQERREVYFEGKPYTVQALRLSYSQAYGGLVYQAEIVQRNNARWNQVLVVGLESLEVEQ